MAFGKFESEDNEKRAFCDANSGVSRNDQSTEIVIVDERE